MRRVGLNDYVVVANFEDSVNASAFWGMHYTSRDKLVYAAHVFVGRHDGGLMVLDD
jgi:hypothetical protein